MIKLIKDSRFKNVLNFAMGFRLIMALLITPILMFFGRTLLRYHQVQFLSNETLLILAKKPSVWIFAISFLLILMFLLMVEISSVVLLSEYEDANQGLLPVSLDKIGWTLNIKNLGFLPILVIVLLGFHFGMSSMITDTLFIPEFILDTIQKTPPYLALYTGILIGSFIIAFHLVFIFHNLFLRELSINESIRNSIRMVYGHRLSFLIDAIKMNIKVF